MCQPLIETCLKFDDTVSFVELDVDIENEVKDKSLQEFEKVSSLRKVFSIESIDRESSLNSANICIKYYWINQSQDILTHPPKLIS
ncbi:hypothetical protein LX97_01560 [Nonlabens dokdonensis]|jgi:hypothetical protein|uniref:Uncharacterized protein n=3 Tax=Nonlabens dokdonensis TaxID=328515 RepID=L7WEF1_NONDD|nr:hypothetical protein DDD_2126 [Nonlabens dokdonensis DSW-6]PZX40788.1 hypothetical protein LX97_01560 [Nonlabens dokdonensis]